MYLSAYAFSVLLSVALFTRLSGLRDPFLALGKCANAPCAGKVHRRCFRQYHSGTGRAIIAYRAALERSAKKITCRESLVTAEVKRARSR